MAILDYSKQSKNVAQWHKDQTKLFEKRCQEVDKARVIALKAEHWLEAKKEIWEKQNKELLSKNKTWLLMAEEIVRLQKEQGDAKKSKDKAKVKALELDIKKIDSRANLIIDQFTTMYDRHSKDAVELGNMLRALQKLGL